MYEPIIKLWKQYCAQHASKWTREDPRHHLAAEVQVRLEQLSLVLDHLGAALRSVAGDPEERRQDAERFLRARTQLLAGEIAENEFFSIVAKPKSTEQHHQFIRAFEEVRLFREMFYLVAWRLMEVLNSQGTLSFPNLRNIRTRGIRDVRNLLIQHPEHRKPAPDYQQRLIVTEAGPVLKTSTFSIRGATGRSGPDEASVDRGLYVNAEEFRQELEACLIDALSSQDRSMSE